MRILFLDSSTNWNGRARVFLMAARALGVRGYEVTLACAPHSPLDVKARDAGLQVIATDPESGTLSRSLLLRRALLTLFVDVVFVQEDRDDLAAALAIRVTNRGAIVRRWPAGSGPAPGWRGRAARRLAPVTHLLTAAPEDAAPPPGGDVVVRGEPGIDLPSPGRDHLYLDDARQAPRLVCITSAGTRARVLNVLRAVAVLAERHPRVQLALIGPAMPADELRLYAAALNIARTVELVDNGAVDDAIRGAAVAWVVADGDEAAFGCLDAMGRGVPVFAERTPVTQRFVATGRHGELFASLEPPEMAAAVAVLTAQPGRRAGISRAARERVEREFSEREMANGFEQATRIAREQLRAHARARGPEAAGEDT